MLLETLVLLLLVVDSGVVVLVSRSGEVLTPSLRAELQAALPR